MPSFSTVWLLVFILSFSVPVTSTSGTLILGCRGDHSKYTYTYCQQTGDLTGCYYLPIPAQYRSCVDLCDNVIVGSVDEEICDRYCEEYVRSFCEQELLSLTTTRTSRLTRIKRDTTTSILSTTLRVATTLRLTAAEIEEDANVNIMKVFLPLVLLLVILVVLAAIFWFRCDGYHKLKMVTGTSIMNMLKPEQDSTSVDVELGDTDGNSCFSPYACSDRGDPKRLKRKAADESSLVDENVDTLPTSDHDETPPVGDAGADGSSDATSVGSTESRGQQESVAPKSDDQLDAEGSTNTQCLQLVGNDVDGAKLFEPSNAPSESDVVDDHLRKLIWPENRIDQN